MKLRWHIQIKISQEPKKPSGFEKLIGFWPYHFNFICTHTFTPNNAKPRGKTYNMHTNNAHTDIQTYLFICSYF